MSDKKALKKKVSITLDIDVIKGIHKLAAEDERTFSQYINKVLRKHIKEKKKISDDAASSLGGVSIT